MRRTLPPLLLCLCCASVGLAHVGSPDVYYDGSAGPYRLFVTIRTPEMIPGIAQIEIRALEGDVSELQIVPLRIIGEGSQNAPPADTMVRSAADPKYFTGKLWLMESGSWQVRITALGNGGKAEMAVPVPAFARRTLRMQKTTGAILLVLMTLLVSSFIAIFGAAARESQLEPGTAPGASVKLRGRVAMVCAALVVLAILLFGNWWWDSKAEASSSHMLYKRPPMDVSLTGGNQLQLKLGHSSWHEERTELQLTKIVPDHGHLMHLFLIRMPGMDYFAHLHPNETPAGDFAQPLPAVPAGDYAVFGDIVRESGFPDTATSRITLPAVPANPATAANPDDSEIAAPPLAAAASGQATAALADGAHIRWLTEAPALRATSPVLLRFRVEDAAGQPVSDLQPYMGMAAHLVIVRRDLAVFAHVHPAGSVPMAALMLLHQNSPAGDSGRAGMNHDAPVPAEITFPYGFPQPGDYRLFLQIKRANQIETGVFDTRVQP